MEEARNILIEEKETYVIPLKITKPEIGIEDLGDKLFKQTLAKYTTIYDAGEYNRSHNIALAAKTINGTILLPGETFSYNKVLGKRTAAGGYKEAGGYAGGRVVQTLAGGICQISSTLYDAVVMDIIWFCHDPYFVFKGTEDMLYEYHNYWFHIKESLIGEVLALVICAIVGLVIQFIL